MTPRVSICVPNLNTRPFLPERFRTILDQTYQDWELLVYDSHSDDGAWEYIRDLAAREGRVRAWQGPREGTPGSWNPCVREARGEFVYIATSDDTMPPDCLQKLVSALAAHPECDLAHCRLRPIDENGRDVTATSEWWSQGSAFALSSGPLLHRPHVRWAPLDGLLHLLGGGVYASITQLLIRRSLFDRVGPFKSTWGSAGDFNWCMRAGLLANTVHVPETWGGWRLHTNQATASIAFGSAEHAAKIDAMIDHAVDSCASLLSRPLRECLPQLCREAKQLRELLREAAVRSDGSAARRRAFLLRRACAGSAPARAYVKWRLRGGSLPDWLRSRVEQTGCGPVLVPVGATTSGNV